MISYIFKIIALPQHLQQHKIIHSNIFFFLYTHDTFPTSSITFQTILYYSLAIYCIGSFFFFSFLSLTVGGHTSSGVTAPTKHTTSPIVTGTTVIGIKYNGGVMLAADTLASYGSMARYKVSLI